MYIIASLIIIVLVIGFIVLQQPVFGASPNGQRLKIIKQSKNYRNGKFQNLSPTPRLAEGYSLAGVLYNFFFNRKDNLKPLGDIPSIKTDLKSLPSQKDLLIWFGHSSYLLQVEGKTILVDPVLSAYGAPFSWMNKAFNGASTYKAEDLPPIDYLLITHDHYDHLDYETIKKLKGKVSTVICGLGVGAHFEKWGYEPATLIEKNWGDKIILNEQLTLHITPARHFSGRSLVSNNTLWTSYVLTTPTKKIFIGGDSGYDKHFKEIGAAFGSFDLAILENGQYNEAWRNIHTLPEEVLQASIDLHARRTFPVHSGKFDLGGHPWNEPFIQLIELNKKINQPLITPMIGEVVELDKQDQLFQNWWENCK